ncbi:class I adenylate-forming enzyme family protein [Galactobacter valiniphilus]|uniref:class I adenylate-forming enzyme family protein n=1 Tax=Galactobacter valiniphilus TaxID=2676122 RepID=UPI003736A31C
MADLVASVLAAADAAAAETVAIRYDRRSLGYRELAGRVRAGAESLRRLGLAPGDRVLFTVRPGPDAVVLALAIVHAGGTVVFADPGAGAALFAARASLAAPRWVAAESLLHLASTRPLRRLARSRGLDLPPYASIVPEARHLHAGPWLPGTPRGAVGLRALFAGKAGRGTRPGHAASGRSSQHDDARPASGAGAWTSGGREGDEALVVFTSGTTGTPKAVVHTRGSLGNGLSDFAAGIGLAAGQNVLTDQLMVGVPALIAGATWTFPPHGTQPGAPSEAYLDLLDGADVLFTPPATMDALLKLLALSPRPGTARVRTISLGGAPVLRPLVERIHERFPNAAIRTIYGMTEVLPVAIGDGLAKLATAPAPDGGDEAGTVVPSVRARVEDGELILSGPGLARGYLADLPGNPLTEHRTGDLVRLDGNRLTLLGRKKDMFIRGTQNVYPGLYEPLVAGLPGVSDAVLTGVPDGIGDDRLVLVVIPEDAPPVGLDAGHPLTATVAAALPGLMDAGALPDLVLATDAWPRAGRQQKLDRRALAAQVGAWAAQHPGALPGDSASEGAP